MTISNDLTVDEAVALLKRTSLPTILVEGTDDLIVYRRYEECLAHLGVSVLPLGGRSKVLEVFLRRAEIPQQVQIGFIVDRDTWIHTGVPNSYEHPSLIVTSGYSIENDVFLDGNLLALLRAHEAPRFVRDLSDFIEWYALALERHLADPEECIGLHPDHVLDQGQRETLLQLKVGEMYPQPRRELIEHDYARLLRGKSLLSLLIRHTNYPGRQPRHNSRALMEMVAVQPGALLNRLLQQVAVVFAH